MASQIVFTLNTLSRDVDITLSFCRFPCSVAAFVSMYMVFDTSSPLRLLANDSDMISDRTLAGIGINLDIQFSPVDL